MESISVVERLLQCVVGRVFAFWSQGRKPGGAKHLSTFFSAIGFSAVHGQHIHGSAILFLSPIPRALQIVAVSLRLQQLIVSFSPCCYEFPPSSGGLLKYLSVLV